MVVEGSGLRAPVMGLRALAKKLQGEGVAIKLQVSPSLSCCHGREGEHRSFF